MSDSKGFTDPPADLPPWEQPGAVRRDCASHRGAVLGEVGHVAIVAASGSLCCFPGLMLSLPLGLVVWLVARRDLREMAQGRMDPAGCQQTWQAAADGKLAFWMSLVWLIVVLVVILIRLTS